MNETPRRRPALRLVAALGVPLAAGALFASVRALFLATGFIGTMFEWGAVVLGGHAVAAALAAAYLASGVPRRLAARVAAGLAGLAYGYVAGLWLSYVMVVAFRSLGIEPSE